MSTIPTSVTEEQFEEHIESHLRIAKRGFVSKIALYKMFDYIVKKLYTGCQWNPARRRVPLRSTRPGRGAVPVECTLQHPGR